MARPDSALSLIVALLYVQYLSLRTFNTPVALEVGVIGL
jgi:hypothetical protein